ncbi:MAG: T9SS type A sorting domain-containing protein [Candidatus Cloacimonadales bacterium]|nr:T9SS type A sorting domain-containing protein [Candidatus Cloacimonadales bacterium]
MRLLLTIFCLFLSTIIFCNPISGYKILIEYDPITVISNYFDFNISTPNGIAVRKQPDSVGGGTYFVFDAKESSASTLRTYYGYLDANGILANVATIGMADVSESSPSLAIDPVTGDPIVAWNSEYGIKYSYDYFHLGSPGLWTTPYQIFDDISVFHHSEDVFVNPIVEIGDSPIPDKRRVYFLAYNQREFVAGEEYCHAMLGYDDFDVNFFNAMQSFDLTYVPLLISQDEVMNFSFTIGEEGKLAIAGYTNDQKVFTYLNENFGEGNFTAFQEEYKFPVENPLNLNGTPRFTDDQGNPYDLFFGPQFAGNFNAMFTDNDEKIIFPTCFSLAAEPGIYRVEDCLIYPKIVSFDLSSEEFSFIDIQLEGNDPDDDLPMLPWDIDEDGTVDSYDMDGKVDWFPSWPIYYYENTLPYPLSLNNLRITQNIETGLISVLWNDSSKAYLANNYNTGLSDWINAPEIVVTYSDDYGEFWYPSQYLNSINNPELNDMIPEFIYPADEISELGYGEYELRTMFYNDFGYALPGSFPQTPGGQICSMALKYEIDEPNNYIIINEPNAASVWEVGTMVSVAWSTTGTILPIKFDLVDENDEFVCCVSEDPEGDNFEWIVPSTIPSGDEYQVRAMVLSPPGYEYSLPFTIYNPDSVEGIIPIKNHLFQNTPNPFNPTTTISFSLTAKDAKDAKIEIYNLKGQKVKVFTFPNGSLGTSEQNHQITQSPNHQIVWDGTDQNNKPVSSGVYLYKLKAGDFEESRKMLLLK